MADGDRCGPGCYSSTTLNAVVYFPPGTYLVSSTVETYYGTQVIGDAINPPTIKASSSFTGLGVLSTDRYVGGGSGSDGLAKEWFINTANFYRQIRNIKIDITGAPATTAGLHYQVAQASSLQNVDIQASTSGGTGQQGIFAENGSGGFMSDVTLRGGNVSFYTGNQQFTSHRVRISDSNTAIQLIWDWGWVRPDLEGDLHQQLQAASTPPS
ncbi:hypothetical protein VTK73DRAFT_5544 [Phialemonium thermophilum]|uniref:Rhamnogalacturonase A/B/Epimerase-like pectate lyase domain-containing protein n=1 Tax=Phialemonium thermophilum TaxID=223376 RepID=A0ABR3V237_9PEZI